MIVGAVNLTILWRTKLSRDSEEILKEGDPVKVRVQEILEEVIRQQKFILELDAITLPKYIDIDMEIQKSSNESIKINKDVHCATNCLESSVEDNGSTRAIESAKLPSIQFAQF